MQNSSSTRDDSGKFFSLVHTLKNAPVLIAALTRAMIRPLSAQVKKSYNTSTSPDNEPFAPLQKPTGLRPVIGLRDFYEYRASGTQIFVSSSKFYSIFHYTGTRFIPPRSPWPRNGQIPSQWKQAIGPQIQKWITSRLRNGTAIGSSSPAEGT